MDQYKTVPLHILDIKHDNESVENIEMHKKHQLIQHNATKTERKKRRIQKQHEITDFYCSIICET